jgi:hypothetical protein
MTEMDKLPEQEVPGEQKATGWESLENYDDFTHHSPLEKVPAVDGNDLLGNRVFFRDAIVLTQNAIPTSPETPEENQALLDFGGVYVLVDKDSDSDPKKLEAAWARAMRGHYNQEITVTDNIIGGVIGSYPLVTDTLDNIPKEILEAEAAEDKAKRLAGNEKIQEADAIINSEETYRRLKDEVWDVELTFKGNKTYTDNVYGDKQNQPEEDPFDSASEAKFLMQTCYAVLWAKLMQARLNENKNVAIADVAEESLNQMDVTLYEDEEFVKNICNRLGRYNWEHCAELNDWYNKRIRELSNIEPLSKEAR